jgi:ABC-type Fe3+-hydroxamate transport system substrate-binding protein
VPRRVVSLVPSVTETLLSWGVTPIAVTRFCEAEGVVTVGGTKNPDLAAIVALAPDLVIMDKEENRAIDAETLVSQGVVVHATHIRRVDDVGPMLRALAGAIGAGPVSTAGPPDAEPTGAVAPQAFVPIWRRPWMTLNGATYGSSILARAGIGNVFAGAADPYPQITLQAVAALAPDVVLAPSEPYPFSERHRAELEAVAPVVFVDGRDLFWWGTRTAAALARLRRLATGLPTR